MKGLLGWMLRNTTHSHNKLFNYNLNQLNDILTSLSVNICLKILNYCLSIAVQHHQCRRWLQHEMHFLNFMSKCTIVKGGRGLVIQC